MANFNLNKVILGGRLTAEPELKQTPSGVMVLSFSIAVNRAYRSKADDGQMGQQQADFINCVAWRERAEFIARYFHKGSSICVAGQIQTRTVIFQHIHHPQALLIVAKRLTQAVRQRAFTGVAEGGVAQIMAQGNGLRQILIQRQRSGDGSADPGDLQGMGHAGTIVITLRAQKHLGLVHQTAEGLAVDDPVAVPLIASAYIVFLRYIRHGPALAAVGKRRQGI